MTTGTSKLRLLLEMDNKLKGDLNFAKNQVEKATGGMQRRLNSFKIKSIENLAAVKNEIPGIGRAMDLLKNPAIGASAAVVSVGMVAKKVMSESIIEAEKFSAEFRQLQMLNLDKPFKEMNKYKALIRSTALEKGFDLTKSSTAYFDVQSTTGQYGIMVDRIIAKQGEFAQLMQADFNNYISGTAKAMKNFGFGYDKLDEFNRSAFATVQTGVTTFDELAKVQSVYAGAAASAKQDFSAANKIFSIFTTKVKSVDEAATLTKSLFNDLTKVSTINAFDKIGIDVYDSNNHFKQADELLLELQGKFRELGTTDSSLINLKNQFTGSEGLINFVQAATDKTNQLQNVINTFDSTQFSLPKALEIAKNDVNYINEQLKNKWNTQQAEIGDKLLPTKTKIGNMASKALDRPIVGMFPSSSNAEQFYQEKAKSAASNDIFEKFPEIHDVKKLTQNQFDDLIIKMDSAMKSYGKEAFDNRKYNDIPSIHTGTIRWFRYMYGDRGQDYENYHYAISAFNSLKQLINEAREARIGMPVDDSDDVETVTENSTNTDTNTQTSTISDMQSIASGSQSKSISISIDSFIKNFNPTHQSINNMSADELERYLRELFTRVIMSAERISV